MTLLQGPKDPALPTLIYTFKVNVFLEGRFQNPTKNLTIYEKYSYFRNRASTLRKLGMVIFYIVKEGDGLVFLNL